MSSQEINWLSTKNTDIPSGAQFVTLYNKDGVYSAFRILANAKYYIPKHMHSYSNEYVSVITGTIKMDCWVNGRKHSMVLTQGGFAKLDAKTFHALTFLADNTQVEIHFEGKYNIIYANPSEDPRLSSK